MIRLLIVDDHALFTESLQLRLQQDEDIQVVGVAADGYAAIEACGRSKPDVLLMDIKMADCDGLKAAKIVKNSFPETKVIILTTFESKENIVSAIAAGADGYVLKDATAEQLILAVKCVISGFGVFQRSAYDLLRCELIDSMNPTGDRATHKLKPEDLQIIKLISDGKSNREIAELMSYSEGTIKNKVSKILETLQVKDRAQLVVHALKHDLI